MAEAYSAGTIFLQVVPVFRHTQEKVTAYAKGISKAMGNELDKGGEDAGDRFNEGFEREVKKGAKKAAESHATEFQKQYNTAIAGVQKDLKAIEPKVQNNEARRQLRELKAEIDRISAERPTIRTEADVKAALADLRILHAQIAGLPEVVTTNAKFEAAAATKKLEKFIAFVESVDGKDIEIEVKVDTKELIRAERAMGAFETKLRQSAKRAADNLGDPIDRRIKVIKAELEGLARTDIHIGLNDDIAAAKLDKLMAELFEISSNDVNVGIKVDSGRAFAELLAFKKLRDSIDGNTIHENVDIDTGAATSKLFAFGSTSQGSANAFRAFNIVILAAVAILPVLIPLIGALGGALLALMPILAALGGGLAAVVIGFSGIANAVQALNARSKASAKDTLQQTQSIRNAWYAVVDARRAVGDAERTYAQQAADAARAVADARRSAAESIRSALEQQRQAQEAYAGSVDDVRDAEEALREARKQAKQDAESLKDQIKDNRLAIRQGVLTAFDSTNNLNAVMADGSSTTYDKEQAKIQHAQALQSLHELRDEQKRLAAEQKKQRKEGIDGSDAVQAAQDQLTQAIQAQHDAVQRLGDASRAVDQARAAGAREVADALRAQNRTDEDGKRNVARAAEAARRAQESYNDALKKTNDVGSASQAQVEQAMAVLGPAGREFARFIFSLRKGFYRLRDDIQAVMLPPIEKAFKQILKNYGPGLHDFLVDMGKAFGRLIKLFSKSLMGPAWTGFFEMMDRLGPRFFRQFGKTTILWLETFASLMTITAPWAVKLSDAMLGIGDAVAKWMASKRGTEVIQGFMEYAERVGPKVVGFLVALIDAALNLADALAPWADSVLAVLTGFLDLIGNMNPTVLGLILTGILALVIAFQLAVGAMAAAAGILSLIASEVGLWVFVVVLAVGVVLALIARFKFLQKAIGFVVKAIVFAVKKVAEFVGWIAHLVKLGAIWIANNETVQRVVGAVWSWLKRAADATFSFISNAIGWVVGAAEDLWENLQPIFRAIGHVVGWLWDHVFKPVLGFIVDDFRRLGRIIRGVWEGFIWPVLDLMIHIWLLLARHVYLPLLKMIWNAFSHLGDVIEFVWKYGIRPSFEAVIAIVKLMWNHWLSPIFTAIGDAWGALGDGFRYVYNHFLKPIIDAFIDALGGPDSLKSHFKSVVEFISDLWHDLRNAFAAPIKFVLETVVNNGLIAGFNRVAKFVGSTPMSEIPIPKAIDNAYARGGVLPGYFPGGDNHHFLSPTGGALHLSGGEAIMRPEFTKAVGSGFIETLNQVAANQGQRGVRRLLGEAAGHFFKRGGIFGQTSYANGGLLNPDAKVTMDGKYIAAIAARQILLAEKLRKVDYYLMQGGFGGDHIAASGSSHNYPGVADIARAGGVSFADQAALRQVAFAAWARNIPGAAYVGSGEHVHSASLLSPGTAKSPQVYGSWPGHTDGLNGGPDYGPRPGWLPDLASQLGQFDLSKIDPSGTGGHGFSLPGWILDIAKNPVGWASGLVTKPIKTMYDKFGKGEFAQEIAGLPMHLVKGIAHKALDLIPGGGAIAKAAGFAWDKVSDTGRFFGHGAHQVAEGLGNVADAFGFSRGGILPYNGTMMYDAGGYLPPGLTQVVNLTGKPEPVLTEDQFHRVSDGKGGFTYAPVFHEAYHAEDVLDDLEFTMRKHGREGGDGRYGGTP